MNRKNYTKPSIKTYTIETETIMAASDPTSHEEQSTASQQSKRGFWNLDEEPSSAKGSIWGND